MQADSPGHLEGTILIIQTLLAQLLARQPDCAEILDLMKALPPQIRFSENSPLQVDPLSRKMMEDHLAKVGAGAAACADAIADMATKIRTELESRA